MQSLNCHNWLLAVQDIQVFRGSSFEICGVNPRKCDCIAILRSIDKCMGPLVTRRTPEIERRSEIHFDALTLHGTSLWASPAQLQLQQSAAIYRAKFQLLLTSTLCPQLAVKHNPAMSICNATNGNANFALDRTTFMLLRLSSQRVTCDCDNCNQTVTVWHVTVGGQVTYHSSVTLL